MYTIGIDLGGTNIAAGLCDASLSIIDKTSVKTPKDCPPENIAKAMADLSKQLINKNNIKVSDVEYVGMAIPGSIDPDSGIIEYANNLPFINFPVIEFFKKYLPIEKIHIENDANAAALGEALSGAAKGTDSSVMITLGTGVGGGVIINGKIFKGGINAAGAELGHTVIRVGGRLCTCGRRGCFETYSSATGLILTTKEKMRELEIKGIDSDLFKIGEKYGKINARVPFDAAKSGDKYGQEIVDEYIHDLAEGITNMINIFQPAVLSIGGGVSAEREYLIEPVRKIVERDQYTRLRKVKTHICPATLGNDAGIIGAAGLGK